MEILGITLSVFLLVMLIMSIGVLFKRKAIQGSCGGLSSVMGESSCEICENKGQCKRKNLAPS